MVDIVIMYILYNMKELMYLTFSLFANQSYTFFIWPAASWVSNGSKPWDLPPPISNSGNALFLLVFLLSFFLFIFLLKRHELLSLFLHSKEWRKTGLLGCLFFSSQPAGHLRGPPGGFSVLQGGRGALHVLCTAPLVTLACQGQGGGRPTLQV